MGTEKLLKWCKPGAVVQVFGPYGLWGPEQVNPDEQRHYFLVVEQREHATMMKPVEIAYGSGDYAPVPGSEGELDDFDNEHRVYVFFSPDWKHSKGRYPKITGNWDTGEE